MENSIKESDSNQTRPNKKKLFVAVLGLLLITGLLAGLLFKYSITSRDKTYTKEFQDNFIDSCLAEGGTNKSCSCSVQYLYDNYNFQVAKKLDEIAKSSGKVPSELVEAFKSCSAN